jgi:hypothetical protein
MIAASFAMADKLVVLTANLKGDPEGLRNLLFTDLEPILTERHQGRFGLLVLMSGRKTPWVDYARFLADRLSQGLFESGFHYEIVPRRSTT